MTATLNIGTHTIAEIEQQPRMWMKEYDSILSNKEKIEKFMITNNISKHSTIILTGAGTSAFIGNALLYIMPLYGYSNCIAMSTTDIITHPDAAFQKDKEIVLVSFARSGNSPESLATVELAERLCKKVTNIIVTCNENGQLAKNANDSNSLLLLLPPETNDKSLAMTSSFTTMLLSFILYININDISEEKSKIDSINKSSEAFIQNYKHLIKQIATLNFKRAVFLGSGELKGIAEECHLKLQELTDGQVICKHDSFLGFRHGPKAVIDKDTLLIYLFSSNEHIRKYEVDLVKQINQNNNVIAQIGISSGNKINIDGVKLDLNLNLDNISQSTNAYYFIPYVLIGQLLGYYKSISMGLNPDSPSVSGNIARVVEGVTIYND
ncbi:MAG: hypothetical protein BGO29_08685 [Bacteroidales bacterium 36-12]|nr:MAG: hypothetical protein BGO29_08685 [Bacteroidales bacterium 36-12]